jgi:ABC-type transport system substrate-binding protein
MRVLTVPGPLWEHFDIRLGRGGHPALRRKAVRQALAYGMDRAAVARVYGSLRQGYQPADSATYLSASPSYRPNWSRYRHRPDEARRLLAQAGCSRGADGVYVCGGDRLALRFVTTGGTGSPRERALQLVQERLRQVGIAVSPVYVPTASHLSQILDSGDFDLALFNWIAADPDEAASKVDLYGCGAAQNLSGYCQRLVTRDLDQATRILDSGRLAQVLNRADAQLARDVPVIPLVERSVFAAYRTSLRNVTLDTRAWNPFQNAENWWLAEPR